MCAQISCFVSLEKGQSLTAFFFFVLRTSFQLIAFRLIKIIFGLINAGSTFNVAKNPHFKLTILSDYNNLFKAQHFKTSSCLHNNKLNFHNNRRFIARKSPQSYNSWQKHHRCWKIWVRVSCFLIIWFNELKIVV